MKHITITVISLACWLVSLKAQVTGDAAREIRDLEAQRFRAMETVDVPTLNRILSDDLIYTHANGVRHTKFELIGVLGSGEMKYESITTNDVQVRIFNDTAIVTGRASMKIKARGATENFELTYLDVYVQQEGRWQMVAWQSSRVAT